MAIQLGWDDFWSIYKDTPERLQDEVDALPDLLKGKSAKVQIEIIKFAPRDIQNKLMRHLCIDAQIKLLR